MGLVLTSPVETRAVVGGGSKFIYAARISDHGMRREGSQRPIGADAGDNQCGPVAVPRPQLGTHRVVLPALASELEIPWQVTRGLAVIARAIGLVGHLREEIGEPLATEIWTRVDEEASRHNKG